MFDPQAWLRSLLPFSLNRQQQQNEPLLHENRELKRLLQEREEALKDLENQLKRQAIDTPLPPAETEDQAVAVTPPPEATQPVVEVSLPEMPVLRPEKSAGQYLHELERMASYYATQNEDLNCLKKEMLAFYPDLEQKAELAIQRGIKFLGDLNQLYKLANRVGITDPSVKKARTEFCKRYPGREKQADGKLKSGDAARNRRLEQEQRSQSGQVSSITPRKNPQSRATPPKLAPGKTPTPSVAPSAPFHAQDIRGLSPSSRWTLDIDETGSQFDEGAQQLKSTDPVLGRWVGLLAPEKQHGLPPIKPGWHAADESLNQIDSVFQHILDAHVGVMGLSMQQIPVTMGEAWANGVLSLIDWIIRLLPLDGPTRLEVLIENRDVFTRQMEWPALARDALRRLAIAYPDRAALISLQIRIIDKTASPHNGYVDALAFTWGSPTEPSRQRLKASQLLGHCFLEGDSKQILDAWEWLDRGIRIRPEDWTRLLTQPDAGIEGGLTATILQRLGEACRSDVHLWRSFSDEVRRHLDSKAIDLRTLGKQIDWLENCRPVDTALTPRLRLLWLTARLAAANHLGAIEQDWMSEMQALGTQLMDEDAPLVCWADLHLAVNATNRYDFAAAPTCLQRWRDVPCSVPGLRYWAQACSSLGQHAAFMGDADQARTCFEAALSAFERLSDDSARKRDYQQTATYLAIVETDHADATQSRAAVERVTGPLLAAIERLADQHSDKDKYAHHLMLRWLVRHGSEVERAVYLAWRDDWQIGYGHPWPLIELYRGFLLYPDDPSAAMERALNGYRLAVEQNQGPTVQLIGAACRAVAAGWGQAWPESETLLGKLEQEIPKARNALDAVRAYLTHPEQTPIAFLEQVLPFNFH